MRIKDMGDIVFYSVCQCPDIVNVVYLSFNDLVVGGQPECEKCGKEYTYDENQELDYN